MKQRPCLPDPARRCFRPCRTHKSRRSLSVNLEAGSLPFCISSLCFDLTTVERGYLKQSYRRPPVSSEPSLPRCSSATDRLNGGYAPHSQARDRFVPAYSAGDLSSLFHPNTLCWPFFAIAQLSFSKCPGCQSPPSAFPCDLAQLVRLGLQCQILCAAKSLPLDL